MNSIVYKPLITRGDLAADTTSGLNISNNSSSPRFKYTGYKPQYNWRAPAESSAESETTTTPESEVTPEDPTSNQQIEWEDPSTINWGTTPATITSVETQQQSITTPVQHVFKTPDIDTGEMKEFLDVLADAGIAVRVTSGARPGAKTSSGNISWHSQGRALDITPVSGTTREDFNKLKDRILNAPTVIKYMQDHNIGILDETLDETLQKTGGSGWHFHIGPDKSAVAGLQTWLKNSNHIAKRGMKFPILAKSGIKLPVILAAKGTNIPRKQQKLYDRVTERLTQQNQNKNISPITGLKYEEPLQPLTQEIISFIPGIGDAIEASSIIGNLLNDNWKQALISAGLLVLPGNASKISKSLGFQFNKIPINEYIIINTSKGPAAVNLSKLDIDKNIKNTKSSLAKRYDSGGADRTNLPNLSKEIQTAEPLTGELEGLLVDRNPKQPSFNFPKQNNIPSFIFLSDIKTTLPEVGNNSLNKILTQNQRRQLLDHEIQHKIDLDYRPDFYNSKLDFIDGTEYQKRTTEVGARVGQLKDAAGITDGSKVFTEQELKDLFDNYLKNPENIDNGISTLRKNVKDWTKFTKWVNDNVPLLNKSFKSPLYINSQEDESEN